MAFCPSFFTQNFRKISKRLWWVTNTLWKMSIYKWNFQPRKLLGLHISFAISLQPVSPQIKMRISLSSSLSQTTCFCDMTWQNPLYRHIPKTRRFEEGWMRWWEREGEVLQQRVPPPLRDGDRSVIREPLTHTSHPAARWEAAVLSCLMQPLPSTLGV